MTIFFFNEKLVQSYICSSSPNVTFYLRYHWMDNIDTNVCKLLTQVCGSRLRIFSESSGADDGDECTSVDLNG
jgi:hypothetical protein